MLEKLKSLKINFSLVAFLCFIVKMLVVDASIADSIIVIALGSVFAYSQYIQRFQPYKLDDAVMKELTEVKSALSVLNMKRINEKTNDKRYF